MTEEKKEQLIRHLKYDLEIGADYLITDEDAVEIIKALEQQPNADCISRAYVESIVEELENICINGDEHILSLLSNIKNAPPVTPTISKMEQVESKMEQVEDLIREFDNEHPALFADYMQEFNNHPISELIDYMWDMHCLIEDIRYRLPNEGGEEE